MEDARRAVSGERRRMLGSVLMGAALVCGAGTAWADAGSDDGSLSSDHWSLQPVKAPEVPNADAPWVENPIDGFILRGLNEAGLEPSERAGRATRLRRLYLDMHGLVPSAEEVEAFADDDGGPSWEMVVEEVLASPRYGERWARHWLDVVGYADSHGYEMNQPRPTAYRYRDWVIRALNADKPYDDFIVSQIAGDTNGEGAGTGFLVAGPHDQVKSPDPKLTAQQRQNDLDDMVSRIGTAFLGLTTGCARCHDHKFDPISQKDYFAMQAVVAGVQHGARPLKSRDSEEREQQLKALQKRIRELRDGLRSFEPLASVNETVVVQEDQELKTQGRPGAVALRPVKGRAKNAAGSERGQLEDRGSLERLPNLSGGEYSYWQEERGVDLIQYAPRVDGQAQLWISWGVHPSHSENALFVLDRDGDPETRGDQVELAQVDQTRFADGQKPDASEALWSGLRHVGELKLQPESVVLVRAGDAKPTTADAILVQAGSASEPIVTGGRKLPGMRASVSPVKNVERFEPVSAKFVRFVVEATGNGAEPCLDELEIYAAAESGSDENVALASAGAKATASGTYSGSPKHRLEHINDGRYGNSRSWISDESGRGWIQIELKETVSINRIAWGRDRKRDFTDRLATQYRIEVATESGEWKTVAGSGDRFPRNLVRTESVVLPQRNLTQAEAERAAAWSKELSELEAKKERLSSRPKAYAGQFEQPEPTHLLYRGDPMAEREVVSPDTISVLGDLDLDVDSPEQKRRAALAKWIASRDNPLTARVIVNRIWHYHFGTGLVDTPNDFGTNGNEPTHPALLDWLAVELMRHDWSLKHIHRLIVTSATYQQAAKPNPKGLKVDGKTRLLWRYPTRRLSAEAIRDSILAVSGSLRLDMYGPGFSIYKPNENYVRVYDPKESWGPEEWRRMVYMHDVRMEKGPVFGAFDCPDGGRPQPKRGRSTTPIQALNLLNSGFMIQQSRLMADRVRTEVGNDPVQQVRRAFGLTVAREPTEAEEEMCLEVASRHGLPAVCRALFNASEFLFIP